MKLSQVAAPSYSLAAAAAQVAAGAFAIAVAAQVRAYLPFTPIPVTLQVLAVVGAGLILGPVRGAAAGALYLAVGLAGAPVFAGAGHGFGYLLAPAASGVIGASAGFLLAFPSAASVTGRIWHRRRSDSYGTAWMAAAAGVGVIYGGGFVWLAAQYAAMFGLPEGLRLAWLHAVAPFVGIDLLKALVAASLVAGGTRRLRLAWGSA